MQPVTFSPSRFDRGYFIAGGLGLLAIAVLWLGNYSAANDELAPSPSLNATSAALLVLGALVIWRMSPLGRTWVVIDCDGVTLECTRGQPLQDRQISHWPQIGAFVIEVTGDELADDILSVVLKDGERRAVPLQTVSGSWEKVMTAIEAQADALGYDLAHRRPSNPFDGRHIWTLAARP